MKLTVLLLLILLLLLSLPYSGTTAEPPDSTAKLRVVLTYPDDYMPQVKVILAETLDGRTIINTGTLWEEGKLVFPVDEPRTDAKTPNGGIVSNRKTEWQKGKLVYLFDEPRANVKSLYVWGKEFILDNQPEEASLTLDVKEYDVNDFSREILRESAETWLKRSREIEEAWKKYKFAKKKFLENDAEFNKRRTALYVQYSNIFGRIITRFYGRYRLSGLKVKLGRYRSDEHAIEIILDLEEFKTLGYRVILTGKSLKACCTGSFIVRPAAQTTGYKKSTAYISLEDWLVESPGTVILLLRLPMAVAKRILDENNYQAWTMDVIFNDCSGASFAGRPVMVMDVLNIQLPSSLCYGVGIMKMESKIMRMLGLSVE